MMNYKETLFFIGKCLTITHENHNKILIEKELKSGKIDWDSVVKVSTAHYVFPALYCNLKRADFLHYVPSDLVEYMKHITTLNRKRNQQIIAQAKEINKLLLANNITPIFLKGTGNLLEGLYEDIAERMVGDIDFLVSKKKFKRTIDILKEDGYQRNSSYKTDTTVISRHYPALVKPNRINAVEVHYRLVKEPYQKYFNFSFVKNLLINNNTLKTLSHAHKVLMTCFNKQMNDNGQLYKSIALRNSYDLFLLSKKVSALNALQEFTHYFTPLNNFLAISSTLFNAPKSLTFSHNKDVDEFIKKSMYLFETSFKNKQHRKQIDWYLLQKERFMKITKSLYKKEYFNYSIERIKELFFSKPNA